MNVSFNGGHRGDRQKPKSSTTEEDDSTLSQGDRIDRTNFSTQSLLPATTTTTSSSPSPRRISPKSSLASHHSVSFSIIEPLENVDEIRAQQPKKYDCTRKSNMISDKNPTKPIPSPSSSSSQAAPPPDLPPFPSPPPPPPPPPLPLPPLLSLALPLDRMPGLGGSSGSVKSEKSSPNISYKLSTINERTGTGEEQEETQNDNLGGGEGDHPKKESKSKQRTNSSGNLPDFLSQKLHHQMNITSNFLRSKRKSIAVSTMLRDTTITNPVRMVKESYDSSTSTTTSESYHLNDLPTKNLPIKLATLNKPQIPMFNSSFRRARHSIDVRTLPSYLAKKRQSTFGQLLSVINPTAPDESGSSSDGSLFAEPIAPTLSLGERVAWIRESGPEFGVVKWIGRMPQISNDWVVGVEFDNAIGSGDGTVDGRRYFVAKENFAKFLPITDLTKVDHYAGRPRSGTMLSRMSVQLKPGQLISIQRSPTTTVPHCYLNAPHHVGHDVHSPNNRHCQCHSCNHPCAHICKTRKPKGKRWTEDMAHMCHFSSKPHASMCCGGEDLATACEPLKEPGTSWKHSEVIASLRTVPTEISRQRKTTLHSITMHSSLREPPPPLQSSSLMMMMKKPNSKMDVQRESSPNFDDDLLDRPQQLGSGLLARTGSDLSISSLPSSSSVAEMYIGRSVLTDESDIDSETEKSLESNSKVRNKQGLRSLVACFLANSLRLKSIKLDHNSNDTNKKTNSDRSHSRRVVSGGKHLQHHHHHHHDHQHQHHNSAQQPQSQNHQEKKKQRKAAATTRHNNRLGLSSTDTSYHADIPSSSVAANTTQPFNSLSSDLSHHPMIMMMDEVNPTIQPTTLNSNANFSNNNHKNRSITSNPNKKPMQNLASSSYYSYGSKNSPYRNSEMQMLMEQHHQQHPTTSQHHQIDGHISEEITYTTTTTTSSSSGAQKFTRAESAVSDKRSMNNATSSETFQSPRRRRNKGPAPKPPKKSTTTTNNNQKESGVPPRTTTGCSSSPMSNVDPVSTASLNSFPASLSNSSLTTNASSNAKAKVVLTKSPAQHPPNLVRSLSEQKNINTKILINAMPSFRSEVNLQEVIDGTQENAINEIKENEEELIAIVCNGNKENVEPQSSLLSANPVQQYPEESIYETPLSGKVLLLKEIPPFLPEKTFDPVKVFGCPLNVDTQLLESRSCHDDDQPQPTRQPGVQHSSPGIIRSKSMPFAKYTCCMYHWKEYLSTLSAIKSNVNEDSPSFPAQDACRIDFCDALLDDVCDCNRNNGDGIVISNLTNALLSPKHSLRFKKSDFDLKISSKQTNGGGEGGASNGNSPADNLLNEMNSFEFIRAMSDGSLTNTNSAATVVEYINDEQNDGLKSREEILAQNAQLKDVFCQTSFKLDSPEKLSRNRCCKHKHCRCRSLRYRTHRKDCRYLYSCTLHNDCHANNPPCFQSSENKKCSNVWLTSSTSDHSLSSLSSSNSTLSETTSAMRNVNDLITFSNKNPLSMNFWTSTKPCVDHMNNVNNSNRKKIDDNSSIDRSSISTDKLFKSAQKNHSNHHHNQKSGNNQNQMFPIKPDCFITQTGNGSYLVGSKKPAELNENISLDSFDDIPNEFGHTKTDHVWSRCLMSQLELAIANGDHQKAAILAKELAFKKVNCSLTGKFSGDPTNNASVSGTSELISCDSPIVTYLYIEDRLSHRGPIPFQLYPSMTVDMLKIKVEKDFNIPSEYQQWIFGKSIATNMESALFNYGITSSGCPIFLHIKTPNVDEADFPNPIGKSHETIGSETNGDLLEKDDDSIFETLQPSLALPPYSSNIKDHVSLINEAKINNTNTFNNASTISYIQNPLASLDLDSMNSISSRTSFTNPTPSNGSENFSNNSNSIKNLNFPSEEPQQSYKTELVFESLNFVNEMLPRVEEENEDELEEYNDDDEDEDEENSQNSEQIRSFKPISKIIAHREAHAKLIDIDAIILDNDDEEQFDCPICLGRLESDQKVMLKGCRHRFCRACLQNTIEFSVEVPIKCPCCDDVLGDDEIKESASAETYERYLSRSISEAERKFNKTLSNQCPNSTLEFPGQGNL